MKLAIMQPYLLPYLGYWQLMASVNKYVIYDDVTFIKGGWVNRNNMLLNGKKYLFTANIEKASSFQLINNLDIVGDFWKLLKTIKQAYVKAPYFNDVFPLIISIMEYGDRNLAEFLTNSIKTIASYCGIAPDFIMSSSIEKNNELKGSDKVLHICKILEATTYVNAIGGKDLYSMKEFNENNIVLKFLKTNYIEYKQYEHKFIPGLSILDVLMFNSKNKINSMLKSYELIY